MLLISVRKYIISFNCNLSIATFKLLMFIRYIPGQKGTFFVKQSSEIRSFQGKIITVLISFISKKDRVNSFVELLRSAVGMTHSLRSDL